MSEPWEPAFWWWWILLILLALCCCLCCVLLVCSPCIVRGFCGPWAQDRMTHSNPNVPPFYLPAEQRAAARRYRRGGAGARALRGDEEGLFLAEPVVGPVAWHGKPKEADLFTVFLGRAAADDAIGLTLRDPPDDDGAAAAMKAADGGGPKISRAGSMVLHEPGLLLVDEKRRTSVLVSAERAALAPRVVDVTGLAAASGELRPGDAIVKVHGAYVDATTAADAFHEADVAAAASAEACVELLVLRDGRAPPPPPAQTLTIDVDADVSPAALGSLASLGLSLLDRNGGAGGGGRGGGTDGAAAPPLVAVVDAGSAAAAAGLRVGDEVCAVNGEAVADGDGALEAARRGDRALSILVRRASAQAAASPAEAAPPGSPRGGGGGGEAAAPGSAMKTPASQRRPTASDAMWTALTPGAGKAEEPARRNTRAHHWIESKIRWWSGVRDEHPPTEHWKLHWSSEPGGGGGGAPEAPPEYATPSAAWRPRGGADVPAEEGGEAAEVCDGVGVSSRE